MKNQEIDSSNEEKQQSVWNTAFHDIFTTENCHSQGQILYIGYYAFPTQQQEGQNSNPFAKRLRLVALNISNKHIVWQRTFIYETEGMSVYTTVASWLKVVDGIVYLFSSMTNGASASWLTALDAVTGQEIWQHTGPGGDAGMTVCNGIVFLRDSYLRALDGKTGKLLWSYGFLQNQEILGSSLSATKDAIFFMGYSRATREKEAFVRSLHLTSGEERWNTPLGAVFGALNLYSATLLITEHTIYAIKGSNKQQSDEVVALRVQDGSRLWNGQNGLYGKPLMVENNVLYVSGGEILSALNISTGERLWTQRIEGLLYFSALPNGGLYGLDSATLYLSCLDKTTGQRIWFSTRGRSQSTGSCIAVDKTSIYMITNNHKEIYILDRETGNEQQFLQNDVNEAERFQIIAVG
jgi:outer membrane protein assembly factor BamB